MMHDTPNLDMYNEDSLNLKFLISLVQKNFKLIAIFAIIPAILTSIWALQLPNVYTAKAVLNSNDSSPQTFSQGKDGLSALANLRVGGESTKVDEAMEIIKSFKYFEDILLQNYPIEYFTGEVSWDDSTNKLTILDSQGEESDNQAAHRAFLGNNLLIGKDLDTDFTFIGITHVSPHLATSITNTIISSINELFRKRESDKSEIALNFMQDKLEGTIVPEIRGAFAEISKMHIQKLAFIESNKDYVFQVLSPAYPPNIKSGPFRSLFVLIAFALGGLFGIIFSYLRTIKTD
jgi:uncharacterized protein involved in exopolysaccharide biosynthesis